MQFRVLFENRDEEVIDTTFPSLAAREVAERLEIQGHRTCAVVEPDGNVTHWRVSLLKTWYARPIIEG